MRRSRLAVTTLFIIGSFSASPVVAQSAADSAAIRAVALDYIEGWYGADAARMERAVHPELAKRLHLTTEGRSFVQQTGASALVAGTARGGGSEAPEGERRSEVVVFDVFRGAASVKVEATDWVDYLHLVRTDDGWKILNVLWELREPPGGW